METTDLARMAADINTLAAFLGPRDVDDLTQEALRARTGRARADVMVLFGGSILAGGDVLASAMRADVAQTYIIVGGAGHTTEALRRVVRTTCPDIAFDPDAPEATIFDAHLSTRHHLHANHLETASTNCGNNITFLRDLLIRERIPHSLAIFAQDATMQRRMEATSALHLPETTVVNYATYRVQVSPATDGRHGRLAFDHIPLGMWNMERYLTLLMGEVPRLVDDENGYGPRGKGFLAHVNVPDEVRSAWGRLAKARPDAVRQANPAFAG